MKLEVSGDIVGALAGFEAIPQEKRDFDTRLHIASCHRKLGHLLQAEKLYDAIRTDPKADQPTIDTAASDLDVLRATIPVLVLRPTPAAHDVEVTVDEQVVTAPSEKRVDPGSHAVRARRAGKVVFERTLQVTEGSKIDVPIDAPTVAAPATAPAPAPAKPEQPSPTPEPSPARTNWGAALPFLGAGAGLIGVAVVSRFMVGSARSDVHDACATQSTPTCDTDAAGGGKVRRWEAISYVSGGLGLVAAGIGIAIVVRSKPEHATASIVPSIGQVNGLSLEGRF
ncbi:MAG: hypothetical protein ACXWUG_00700 [Polyangiales bacterium]